MVREYETHSTSRVFGAANTGAGSGLRFQLASTRTCSRPRPATAARSSRCSGS